MEDFYACDYGGRVIKLSRTFLTNYVGDLLITQEGGGSSYPSGLFIVNWRGTNFVTRAIYGDAVTNGFGQLEDATFSPLNLPLNPDESDGAYAKFPVDCSLHCSGFPRGDQCAGAESIRGGSWRDSRLTGGGIQTTFVVVE